MFRLLLLCLLPALLPAQERIRLTHSCAYDGEENATEYYSFAPSTEADRIVQEICEAKGLAKNFIVKSANVRNAVATMDGGKRIVLYSTLFLEKFKADAHNKWAAYSVLAHEIGHHLNGHAFGEKDAAKRKMMELEADQFSGSALRMLGAPLEDAKAGIELFALEGETKTHPPGSARREAVASGWKKQDELLAKVIPKPIEPAKERPAADRDQDGISDSEDECPDQRGLRALKGCPDADNDGVPDHKDDCPTVPGLATSRGCPANYQVPQTNGTPKNPGQNPIQKPLPEPPVSKQPSSDLPEMQQDRIADKWGGVLILVRGGTCKIGSNMGESDEKPVHPVMLSDFYLGETEVTQEQWRAVMGADPPDLFHKSCNQCPVEGVSWEDIQAFLRKLNSRSTSGKFRLPTEAEWEYAAKGGAACEAYPYAGSAQVNEVAWSLSNATSSMPVKSKKPNRLGLYDMSGNVWEWCSDWYGGYTLSGLPNPTGPSAGEHRIIRGGSWTHEAASCRVAARSGELPSHRDNSVGFRLVFSR